jgi:hypothetical protein
MQHTSIKAISLIDCDISMHNCYTDSGYSDEFR